jgi:hypothetical protein
LGYDESVGLNENISDIGGERRTVVDLGYAIYGTSNGKYPLMDARDDLADTSLYAGLVTEISDIFASLADDDAGIFGADERTQGEGILGRRGGRMRVVGGC